MMDIHVVKKGETLTSIAGSYGVSPSLLALYNQISRPEALVVGQTLVVLYPQTVHTVLKGQTLSAIAKLYGVSLNTLYRNNIWLGGRDALHEGQSIVIAYVNAPSAPLAVSGYAYTFAKYSLLRETLPYVTIFMPFTYGFTPTGALVELNDRSYIALAKEYGSRPYMHLSTLTEEGGFSNELAVIALTDNAVQNRLLNNVIEVMKNRGYVGLDIDFEFIPGEYAAAYADFVENAVSRCQPYGYEVITALAPKTYAGQEGLLYSGHDYSLIGAASDRVLLMTYEWGYTYGHLCYM